MIDNEKKGGNKVLKVIGYISTIAAALGAITLIIGHLGGWFTWFREDAVADNERQKLESTLQEMAEKYREAKENKHLDLPFEILAAYNQRGDEIDSAHKSIIKRLDSSDFILQQTTNLLFSNAFTPVKLVYDAHGCRYWFHVDPAGGNWWRERIENNGSKFYTFQYRMTFNPTNGSFEYTDVNGQVQAKKHNWPGVNSGEDE